MYARIAAEAWVKLAKSLTARAHVERIGVGFGNKYCLLGSTGSQLGDRADQSSVLLASVSFVKRCPGLRQQSVRLMKTKVVLDLKLNRTDAKPSVEDLCGETGQLMTAPSTK